MTQKCVESIAFHWMSAFMTSFVVLSLRPWNVINCCICLCCLLVPCKEIKWLRHLSAWATDELIKCLSAPAESKMCRVIKSDASLQPACIRPEKTRSSNPVTGSGRRTGTDYCLANTRTWFLNFNVGPGEEWEQEFGLALCWLSSCFSGGPDWATERRRREARKWARRTHRINKWSVCGTGGLFGSESDCFIATQGVSGSMQQTMGQHDQYWHSP